MAGLIDTSTLIELERQGTLLADRIPGFLDEHFTIASITVSELLVGVHRASSGARRLAREQGIERIIKQYPVLPFDLPEAKVHAALQAEMMTNGQLIGAHDLIIAATALAHDHFVLTHNLRDFQRVPGLTVKAVDW